MYLILVKYTIMKKTKYTKKLLQSNIGDCYTFSDLIRRLTNSEKVHGSMIAYIKKKLDEYNIDYSHFTGRNPKSKGSNNQNKKEDIIRDYLDIDAKKYTNNTNLKKWLYKFNLIEETCSICSISNNWNNNYLSLQLDHINGNNRDNRLENLRILCPNCHSQTKNYAGKKNKNRK